MSYPKVLKLTTQDAKWVMTPEFGGGEAVLYRSDDRRAAVVAFRESGSHSFDYPFHEFAYVVSGSAKVSVRGGPTFTVGVGDILFVEQGAHIDFEMSPDFEDITVLFSDKPVSWRSE